MLGKEEIVGARSDFVVYLYALIWYMDYFKRVLEAGGLNEGVEILTFNFSSNQLKFRFIL